MTSSEVVLITRVRTNNKGNQALSAAWAAMLQQAFPDAPLRILERRPRHLLQYSLHQFATARDPFRAFDSLAARLARLAPGPDAIAPARSPPVQITLDETISQRPWFPELRRRINVRRWAALAGVYRETYRQRLAAFQRAQLVVVNPAGEFFPEDPAPALYHLLDLYVAHKLGRPAAIVNHTMDITDPTLRRLIPKIYRSLDFVGFRDEKSVAAFREMGGDLSNVLVTPDLALTTRSPRKRTRSPGRIAVAIHTPGATWIDRATPWIGVIEMLKANGFDVVLVSNELPSDEAFFDQVRQRVPIVVEGAALDYDQYAELLGSFDFVVSSRMHTSILAMVAGTPVIPVEGPSFKITGLFQELGIARPVIQPTKDGWTDQIIEQALRMREGRAAAADEVVVRIDAIRARITAELAPRLRQILRRS